MRIYLLVGEPERALDRLEPLLKMPYFPFARLAQGSIRRSRRSAATRASSGCWIGRPEGVRLMQCFALRTSKAAARGAVNKTTCLQGNRGHEADALDRASQRELVRDGFPST